MGYSTQESSKCLHFHAGKKIIILQLDRLQNAKVMAREKHGEEAEKVLLMGKNPLENSLFKAVWLLQWH